MADHSPDRLYVESLSTPIGGLLLTHDGQALWNVAFEDREQRRTAELTRHVPGAILREMRRRSSFSRALGDYFDGDVRAIDNLRVAVMGTPFQRRAWKALRDVPVGTTRSYGEQAALMGRAGAARAVGRANGLNPVSVVVPCHRLVGSDGALVHYGGGLQRKRWLIDHEARHGRDA